MITQNQLIYQILKQKKACRSKKITTEFLKAERNYGWKESSNSFQKRFYGWVLNEYNYSFDENLNSVA